MATDIRGRTICMAASEPTFEYEEDVETNDVRSLTSDTSNLQVKGWTVGFALLAWISLMLNSLIAEKWWPRIFPPPETCETMSSGK